MVSYTTIEIQILFETLLALITSQLAIIGQLGGEVHHEELDCFLGARNNIVMNLSQIRYSLVVILELNSVSGIQYKDMMIDR